MTNYNETYPGGGCFSLSLLRLEESDLVSSPESDSTRLRFIRGLILCGRVLLPLACTIQY